MSPSTVLGFFKKKFSSFMPMARLLFHLHKMRKRYVRLKEGPKEECKLQFDCSLYIQIQGFHSFGFCNL